MAQASDLLDIVLDDISPKVVDTVLTSNVLLQTLQSRLVRRTGKNVQYPIRVTKQGNAKSFDGFDLLNTNYTNNNVKFSHLFRNVSIPIVLADTDVASSEGEQAIIDFITMKTQEAAQELAEYVGDQIYGDGTGNGGKDLLGLAAAVKTSGTYGGLDYGTYTTLQSTVDSSTALSALTLAKLDEMYSALKSGNNVPTHIFTTKAIFTKLKSIIAFSNVAIGQPFVTQGSAGAGSLIPNAMGGLQGNFGFTELYYNGMPIIQDERCPSGRLYMMNLNTWDLNVQEMPAIMDWTPITVDSSVITGQYDINVEKKFNGFCKSKAVRAINQAGTVSHLAFRAALACNNPRRNGVFTALT